MPFRRPNDGGHETGCTELWYSLAMVMIRSIWIRVRPVIEYMSNGPFWGLSVVTQSCVRAGRCLRRRPVIYCCVRITKYVFAE